MPRLYLSYTRVTSPISGVAGQQQVTEGAVVGSSSNDAGAGGTLLTTVQQIDPVYVNFTISSADLITLRQAQSAGSVALAAAERDYGTDRAAQSARRYGTTRNARLLRRNGEREHRCREFARTGRQSAAHELLPGMYVTLTVDFGRQNGVFLIPQQALRRDTVRSVSCWSSVRTAKSTHKNVERDRQPKGTDWIVTQRRCQMATTR